MKITKEPEPPSPNIIVDLQNVSTSDTVPKLDEFRHWVDAALKQQLTHAEVCIRIVEANEMATLNQTYRNKQGTTNVLSFPFHDDHHETPLIGDLVICADVVQNEANAQQKPLTAHWAHMVIHGVLHLIGFDHQDDEQANQMESLEIQILDQLGYSNPYGDS